MLGIGTGCIGRPGGGVSHTSLALPPPPLSRLSPPHLAPSPSLLRSGGGGLGHSLLSLICSGDGCPPPHNRCRQHSSLPDLVAEALELAESGGGDPPSLPNPMSSTSSSQLAMAASDPSPSADGRHMSPPHRALHRRPPSWRRWIWHYKGFTNLNKNLH